MEEGMSRMTRILLTNDDGIHSNGLIKLEAALREVGDVYVVAAGEKFELLSRNSMGAPVFATPAIAGNTLILRTTDAVYAVGEREGRG